jgi:hypothetical protein
MKLTKVVKYNYQLSEETLEKDIDSFILEARRGMYSWDYKNNGEGLKIIKQYFRILKEKFANREYEECKICYQKLILFLFDASRGDDKADFSYEDLLAKATNDFDAYIKNYFMCLVKTYDIEELAERVSLYVSRLKDYGFESDLKILVENLDESQLDNLEKRMLIKTEGLTKKDEVKKDTLFFIISLVRERRQKEKYMELCNRFKGILDKENMDYLLREYDEE